MFETLKVQWGGLRRGKPGRRFQDSYAAARKKPSSIWLRIFSLCVALVAFVLGLIFAVLPGPAVVFFAVSGGLLATESRTVAKLLDWGEVRLWMILRWARGHWDRLGLKGRVAVVSVGVLCSMVTMLVTWRIMFR
jgi:hypothetical protein